MNSNTPFFRLTSRALFTLAALCFAGVILWISSGYPRRARQVPEVVALFSLACLVIQFLLDSFPRLGALYGSVETHGFFSAEQARKARSGDGTEFKLELITYSWLAFLLAGLLLLGFLVFIPVYVLLYLRLLAKLTWTKSVAFAAGTWLFVYFLFVRLFEIRLYEGILLSAFFDL